MENKPRRQFALYYAYHQFVVYDTAPQDFDLVMEGASFDQGFARKSCECIFRTLDQFGDADIAVYLGPYEAMPEYQRVIAVPFEVVTGNVKIESPDDIQDDPTLTLPVGYYRLVVAQELIEEEQERVDIWFEPRREPVPHSEILVADPDLKPTYPLVEDTYPD